MPSGSLSPASCQVWRGVCSGKMKTVSLRYEPWMRPVMEHVATHHTEEGRPEVLPSDVQSIYYVETGLASLEQNPLHFQCGIYLICVEGCAEVSTGVQQYKVDATTELIFLTGTLMRLVRASSDFRVRLLMFPKDVFLKAVLPIDTPYFNYAYEHPCYRHTDDERSRRTWREINLWMDLARALFTDGNSQFRALQEHDYLQGLLMWLFNTIQEKSLSLKNQYSRKQLVCHQFMQLVRRYGTEQHQVAFYARRLCISPRYLHQVTVLYMDGRTPKQLIDEQLVAEVKVMLNDPSLSVTQIAERLQFADQSYLCRFFKKNTGMSPKDFRAKNLDS